jgi:hypothetical protein
MSEQIASTADSTFRINAEQSLIGGWSKRAEVVMRNIPSAAERARWLAEVAQALDEAQSLVERMDEYVGDSRDCSQLLDRLEAARHMTHALRLSSDRRIARPTGPN